MANQKSATDGTPKYTAAEMRRWYEDNKKNIERYTKAKDGAEILTDLTQSYTPAKVDTVDKEQLRQWFRNIGSNEKNFRNTARYLYYRSNVFYRLVNWYANMFDLNARKVTPSYNIVTGENAKKFL